MHSFYNFITGPLVWLSFGVFIIGTVIRLASYFRMLNEKERFIFTFISLPHFFRSIAAWLIPFFPKSTRIHPVFYGVSYLFHLMIFLIPVFLLSHIVLLEESFPVSWISLSDTMADFLTILVVAALIFFAVRRLTVPEVKFLTRLSDFLFLLLVALPFITGFIAYHQFFAYRFMLIAHILTGELILILIPFTRFFHMILAPFTRGYTGCEFGYVRHAKDW
jgi:nitrate reductase gamma subunit